MGVIMTLYWSKLENKPKVGETAGEKLFNRFSPQCQTKLGIMDMCMENWVDSGNAQDSVTGRLRDKEQMG